MTATNLSWQPSTTTTPTWTMPLSAIYLHALDTESHSSPPHVYAQIGDEYDEVRFGAGSDVATLKRIYDAICDAVSQCSLEDTGDEGGSSPEGGMVSFAGDLVSSDDDGVPVEGAAQMLARLDNMLSVDDGVNMPVTGLGDEETDLTNGETG